MVCRLAAAGCYRSTEVTNFGHLLAHPSQPSPANSQAAPHTASAPQSSSPQAPTSLIPPAKQYISF